MRRGEHSSKNRLLLAARTLFAEKGYDATDIADITRAAKTSHSQFLKYYSGKEELRTEILEQQWSELTKAIILAIAGIRLPIEQLKLALNMFVSFLENDPEFRAILLLEQTASRNREGVVTSPEFRRFTSVLGEIVNAIEADGGMLPDINPQALRAALVGAVEGMMRDQLFVTDNSAAQYSMEQVRQLLSILTSAACRVSRAVRELEPVISRETLPARSTEDEWIRYYLKLGDAALSPSELS